MANQLNIADYFSLAGRTEKRFEDGGQLNQFDMEIMHGAFGVAGEAGEIIEELHNAGIERRDYDTINLGEEAGDVTWFLAALSRHLELDIRIVDDAFKRGADREVAVDEAANHIAICGGQIIDTVKRHLIYGKPLDTETLAHSVVDCWAATGSFCSAIGQRTERVMEANIAKLASRFGDAYSDQAANFRDLHAERETLDDGLSMC